MATHQTRTYTAHMAGDADVTSEANGATPTDRRPPRILFWSTPESAAEGRITVLACVETVFAMSATAYIAWRTGSLLYIAVPACIAPLLLLRTPHSTAIGLTLWSRYEAWLQRRSNRLDRAEEIQPFMANLLEILILVLVFSFSTAALLFRIVAVGIAVSRHPLATFGAIPGNWRRTALATDLRHPPEIVPGIETSDVTPNMRFARLVTGFRDAPSRLKPLYLIFGGLVLVSMFAPTLLYRWSLKSTSVVYFPLMWAAFKSRRGQHTGEQRLETIASDQTERIVRWYAGFSLIILTILPVVLAAPLQPIIAPVQSAFGVDLVDFWLFTGQIKLWHVVRGINAVITMGLFLFADKALRRIKHGRAYSDELIHAIIGPCLFVRGFLGIYLAAKLLHVVVTSVDWSAVNWRIIPW